MMFGKQIEAAREGFDAQFEEVAEGAHFRPGGVGEPFALTADEQQAAATRFEQQVRRLYWMTTGVLIGSVALLVLASFGISFSLELATGMLVALIGVGFSFAYRRALHAPARQFARRQVPGEMRTKAQVRALQLRKMSWPLWGLKSTFAILICWSQLANANPESGRFWFWLLLLSAIVVGVLMQAIRKLRSQNEN